MYWSKESLLLIPNFLTMMRFDRFEYIRKMLHFVYPLGVDQNKPLCKLEAFLRKLHTHFRTVYISEQHIAIYEYLELWKGRLNFKVYTLSYGIKIYMLCESHTPTFQTLLSTLVLTLYFLRQVLHCQDPLKTTEILKDYFESSWRVLQCWI